jgi:lipid-binding SYLF domain-containing protein
MRWLFPLVLCCALVSFGACRQNSPRTPAENASSQQEIVDRAASVLTAMRSNPKFSGLDDYLSRAQAVLIFPRVVKAGLLLGGEGGTGVLVARTRAGTWSAPAFYSVGGGSLGFQVGFQEASVVLTFMSQAALTSAIDHSITLGSEVSVAAGTLGDSNDTRRAGTARDVYYFAEAQGLFAGVSLQGAVIGARSAHNTAYYGRAVSPYSILLDGSVDTPGARVVREALPALLTEDAGAPVVPEGASDAGAGTWDAAGGP